MSDMLHELENNEAILLMYVAGELPEEERREVEQMLASDGNMRRMYEDLRASWDSAMSAVERLDSAEPAPYPREVAARQVGRMVRQWHAEKLARPQIKAAPPARQRWPWWKTVSTTAAAVLIGFLVWWGWMPEKSSTRVASGGGDEPTAELAQAPRPGPRQQVPQTLEPSAVISTEEFQSDLTAVVAVDFVGASSMQLAELERQAEVLNELSRAPEFAPQSRPEFRSEPRLDLFRPDGRRGPGR